MASGMSHNVWGFCVCVCVFLILKSFFYFFVPCNEPCALMEKWHRKEHIFIIIIIIDGCITGES